MSHAYRFPTKAGTMVAVTIGLYIFTTFCAVVFAVIASLIYSGKYVVADDATEDVPLPEVTLACSVDEAGAATSFLTEMNDGSVMCVDGGDPTEESLFLMQDVNGYFATSIGADAPAKLSLSESLYEGLFMQMVSLSVIYLVSSVFTLRFQRFTIILETRSGPI